MSESTQQPDPSPDSIGSSDEEMQPFVITMPDDPASGNDWYLWAAVLALLALVAFWPAINGTFLWDDDQYVTHNHALLDASGLKEIWKIPPGTIQYYPLTFTVFWVEHHIWENNALGYRVVNLLLHAGAAVVLWRILRRLKIPGAWAAAAIWAVHPLQAESVCWISECKNVLSGVLALGSVLFYLEFAGLYDPSSNRRTWNLNADWQTYAISAGLFLLAMLAKTAVVFLPLAILLILWWKGRLTFARILGTVPMLIIGAALAWETSRLETDPNGAIGASGPEWQLSAAQRLLISGRDFWFYIGKLLVPIHQSFIYPRIVPSTQEAGQWVFLLAAIIFLIVLFGGVGKTGRGLLAAVLCYLLLIFPALGFFNVYPFRYSFVADHFQYLAGIPLIVLAVSIGARILGPLWKTSGPSQEQQPAKSSPAVALIVSILLVVLGATAWIRADVFAEPTKLWEDVLQPDKNPNSWLASYNLARSRQGDAKADFDEADRLVQGGDSDSAKQSGDDAMSELDDSDRLLKAALDNPSTPEDVRYKAHDLRRKTMSRACGRRIRIRRRSWGTRWNNCGWGWRHHRRRKIHCRVTRWESSTGILPRRCKRRPARPLRRRKRRRQRGRIVRGNSSLSMSISRHGIIFEKRPSLPRRAWIPPWWRRRRHRCCRWRCCNPGILIGSLRICRTNMRMPGPRAYIAEMR